MKKIFLILILIFLFTPIVKADLTEAQANDIGEFAINFANEGNSRIGADGFPLFAYMQGQARIDGYQSKLYMVNRDYKGLNVVNAYKWTFDCSSFASFIYYKTFNLVLTKSILSTVDSYSGLKLRRETANPYEVKDFYNDASNSEHFYFVKRDIAIKDINYNELKKGDLIIIKDSHIMVYVGNGKIAHASSSAISANNLGLLVGNLSNLYASNQKVYVIRVKNNIIRPSLTCTKEILFPDTNQMVKLVFKSTTVENKYPTINYSLSTNEWTNSVTLKFELTDEIGLKSYTFNNQGFDISGQKVVLTKEIANNGTYAIEVKNLNNYVKTDTIVIQNIDNISPLIENIQVVEYENYKKLVVKASDNESGLNSNSYSFDGGRTWTYSSFIVNEYKDYEIWVKDNIGNITRKTYSFTSNKIETEPKINNIIFGEKQDETKKVIITVSECDNCKIAVTSTFKIPDERVNLTGNQYTTYLKKGNYYIWLEYNGKIVDNKSFTVSFESQTNIILYAIIILGIISVVIFLIVGVTRKRKDLI